MKKNMLAFILSLYATASFADNQTHWTYQGEEGSSHWGNLSDKFSRCKTGNNQSPIDIKDRIKAWLPPLNLEYHINPTEIVHNGHTIQVNVAAGSFLNIDNKRYELKQFHFHSPSENRINGQSFPLEAHLVHTDKEGNLAVIGLMYEMGYDDAGLAQLWQKMPKKSGEKVALTGMFKEQFIALPFNKNYYRFNGSLTTPPCTEGVKWMVLATPASISVNQIALFRKVMGHPNNRPLQPLNARVILE